MDSNRCPYRYWGPKIIAWLLLIVLTFLIPEGFFLVWGNYFATFGAVLFLLLGLVLLVDLAHTWAEVCLEKIDESDSRIWRGILLGSTLGMYIGSLVLTIVMYVFFAGSGCSMNQGVLCYLSLVTKSLTIAPQRPSLSISSYSFWFLRFLSIPRFRNTTHKLALHSLPWLQSTAPISLCLLFLWSPMTSNATLFCELAGPAPLLLFLVPLLLSSPSHIPPPVLPLKVLDRFTGETAPRITVATLVWEMGSTASSPQSPADPSSEPVLCAGPLRTEACLPAPWMKMIRMTKTMLELMMTRRMEPSTVTQDSISSSS